MYYQVYNEKTGKTYITCVDHDQAVLELERANNPHYFDAHQQVYRIREVDEKVHALFGEQEFAEAEAEMMREASDYDPETEWE